MNYKIKLDVFEGPLDLLLFLIKKNDLDVYDIPITKITEQYMEYIDLMKMLDLDVVGDFLVMAATLMHIKSKMLLPPDPSEVSEEELDPRDELVKRLLEYRKFKEIAEDLKSKESVRQDLFARLVDEEMKKELTEDAKEVVFEVSLFDLISAFTAALRKNAEEVIYEVEHEEYTVEQKVHSILHLLLKTERVILNHLFNEARSKSEIIVTFMAILELIRLKEVVAVQRKVFEDIEIIRNKDNVIPVEQQ